MSRLRLLLLAVAAVLTVSALTGAAGAKTAPISPLADCKAHNGTLTRHYTLAQLQRALKQVNGGTNEYTTCESEISNAIDAKLSNKVLNGPGPGAGGGSGSLVLILVIVVVILLGAGTAFWAYRRNAAASGRSPDPDDPGSA